MKHTLTKYIRTALAAGVFAFPLQGMAQESAKKAEKGLDLLDNYIQVTNSSSAATSATEIANSFQASVTIKVYQTATSNGNEVTFDIDMLSGSGIELGGVAFRLTDEESTEDSGTIKTVYSDDWVRTLGTDVVLIRDFMPKTLDVSVVLKEYIDAHIDPFKYVISDNVTGGARPDKPKYKITSVVVFDKDMNQIDAELTVVNQEVNHEMGMDQHTAVSPELLYPNPAFDFINVIAKPGQAATVNVYNTQGQLIMTNRYNGKENIKLDINALAPGAYILQVQNESGIQTARFIKTR